MQGVSAIVFRILNDFHYDLTVVVLYYRYSIRIYSNIESLNFSFIEITLNLSDES